MEFDKSKILTVVTADQLEEGQLGWINDIVDYLKSDIQNIRPYKVFSTNENIAADFPFTAKDRGIRRYFYPAPEPTYRPFKNAEEFKPYRDKWCIDNLKGRFKIDWHSDTHIYEYGNSFITWEEAFGKYKFEDGTPFGIKEEA